MIKDSSKKIEEIIETIKKRSSEIYDNFGTGPSYHFYKRLYQLRNDYNNIELFLSKDYHIDLLYAALISWGMNSRRAKIKDFDQFRQSICSCSDQFKDLETFEKEGIKDFNKLKPILQEIYGNLSLMKTSGILVSNSKLLHFLFPKVCMPMDRTYTLSYFYGYADESLKKYIEITELSYEIMNLPENWGNYLDDKWNTTVPKLIDNAIILLEEKSVKNNGI
ncbi:MAG: hypothetical protein O8C62_04710 [Candidatus Methanoperedens sp.]|nr:hypothetical protein [Candidatus Methanoperedens sp.]